MKIQTTKKSIKNNFSKIIKINYCQASYLLYFKTAFAYSASRDRWLCDYYEIERVCISTGYVPIGDSVEHSRVNLLEAQARAIVHNYFLSMEERKEQVDLLLHQLITL